MIRRITLALLLLAAPAVAQPYCPSPAPACTDTSALPNAVYIDAADTQVPVLHRLGKKLRAQVDGTGTPKPTTLVYISSGSCTNIPNLYLSPPKFSGTAYFIPADPTFDVTAKTACPCTMPAAASPQIPADMAITIVVPDNVSCPAIPAKPPAGISIFKGPVQGMTFVVPYDSTANVGSSQRAITSEEAYLVMGLGAEDAMVPPWNDRHYIYGRPSTKGTQVSIGASILVPAAKWQLLMVNQIDQSADLAADVSGLTADPNAEKVLGILGTEIYDKSRAKLHALAFRAYHQDHAYWPDSKLTTFDKANVRDGHYVLWSYVQYLAPTTGTPAQAKASVQQLIDSMTGVNTAITYDPGTGATTSDPIDDIIASGLTPQCAMKVQRTGGEGSDLSPYSSDAPCACYFDNKATGATSCATCDTNTPCAGTTVCRRGFCEAK
jgi:hypothetical protein